MKETNTTRGVGRTNRDKPSNLTKTHTNTQSVKVEPIKLQPTAEQMRLAKMMGAENEDPEIQRKIKQATELTARSVDDAMTALHDCDYDLNRAVVQLLDLENDQSAPQGEWQEASSRKKKPATGGGKPANGSDANHKSDSRRDKSRSDDNREFDGRNDSGYSSGRGRRNDRAPPRFQRGRGRDGNHGEGDRGNESRSRDRGNIERGRGRGRGSASGLGGRGRGRGGNRGGFGAREQRPSAERTFEKGPQIDTWTNETADKKEQSTAGGGGGKGGGKGAWTEDWTTDEWTGSLDDTKVFTATTINSTDSTVFTNSNTENSTSNLFDSRGLDSFASNTTSSSAPRAQYEDPSNAFGRSPLQQNSMNVIGSQSSQSPIGQNSLGSIGSGASMPVGQRLDLGVLLPKTNSAEAAVSSQSQNTYLSQYARDAAESIKNAVGAGSSQQQQQQQQPYMSQYAKEATESIKNAVGIGAPSASPSSNAPSNRPSVPQMTNTPPPGLGSGSSSPATQHQQQQRNTAAGKAPRSKLPPPSKIPASAVEMPGEMSYQLDVQFGNLDYTSQENSGFTIGGPVSKDSGYSVPASSTDSNAALDGLNNASQQQRSQVYSNSSTAPAPGMNNQKSPPDAMSYPGTQAADHNSYSSQRQSSAGGMNKPSSSPKMNYNNQSNYSTGYQSSTYKSTTSSYSMPSSSALASSGLSAQPQYGSNNGNSAYQASSFPPSQSSNYSASSTAQNSLYNTQASSGYQNLQQTSSSSYAPSSYHSSSSQASSANNSSKDSSVPAADKSSFDGSQYNANLSESLNKMTVKEEAITEAAAASSAVTSSSSAVSVSPSSALGLNSTAAAMSMAKAQPVNSTAAATSKPPPNLPPGVALPLPQNYMIGQPGMPFAAFQPIQYSYDELQLLAQQRLPLPGYYDMPLQQPSSTITPSAQQTAVGRSAAAQDQTSLMAAAVAAGVNVPYSLGSETSKLPRVDAQSPVNASSAQQPPASQATHQQQQQQQAFISPATLPPSYNYYYPSAAMLPGYSYQPNVFQLPAATNATHGTTASSQFQQKPGAYGSHVTYGSGGQTQDFTKTYGAGGTQNPTKGSVPAPSSMVSSTGDLTGSSAGYGKTHSQSYDKGFHATGTPPPFNQLLNAAAVSQAGAALGQPPTGTYPAAGPSYIPMVPAGHQPQSTHILHHPMQQDSSSGSSRASQQQSTSVPKNVGSKNYSTAYWGAN